LFKSSNGKMISSISNQKKPAKEISPQASNGS
jgi:hypothetical protein